MKKRHRSFKIFFAKIFFAFLFFSQFCHAALEFTPKDLSTPEPTCSKTLETIRSDMNPITGKGFSVIDLKQFPLWHEIKAALQHITPAQRGFNFVYLVSAAPSSSKQYTYYYGDPADAQDIDLLELPHDLFAQLLHEKNLIAEKIQFPEDAFNKILPGVQWIHSMLTQALLPNERILLELIQIRTLAKNQKVYIGTRTVKNHIDGGYLTLTLAAEGAGTILCNEMTGQEQKLATGELLIASCENRAKTFPTVKGTQHKSPEELQDRVLIVIRYKIKII